VVVPEKPRLTKGKVINKKWFKRIDLHFLRKLNSFL